MTDFLFDEQPVQSIDVLHRLISVGDNHVALDEAGPFSRTVLFNRDDENPALHQQLVKPHKPSSESQQEQQQKKSWIEIELVDEANEPVPGEVYEITLPDGTTTKGTLDGKGLARVDGIDPGTCKVTFPNLDKEAWKKA